MDRACAAGVTRILAVGSDLASSRAAVELAAEHGSVFAAVGIHPTELSDWDGQAEGMRKLLQAPKVVAIGEIGLDFVRGTATPDTQVAALRSQLQWAADHDLPVSVHNRGADKIILGALAEVPVTAVLHCFSGTLEFARRALDSGCFLSFAGNVTFPRAEALRDVAAAIPEARLLVESDAPVLAPQPWRGRRNEPAYVRATAETIARVRGTGLEALMPILARNADSIFHWGAA